jgi:serine/threonine-protein kinase RsbW
MSTNFDAVRRTTRVAKAFAIKAGFSCMDAFQIELSLSEALNNIVEHGYKDHPADTITVLFHATDQALEIKIVDHGDPNSDFGKVDSDFTNTLKNLKERGFGQIIIDSLMDDVVYVSSGKHNALTLTKCRPVVGDDSIPLAQAQ